MATALSPSAEEFSRIFREEHRAVRDALLELIEAFEARDRRRIESLLGQTSTLTGPHFRYEEEALYPALEQIFGEDYIEQLLSDHDGAIGAAKQLVSLAGQETLTDEDVEHATRLVRGVLPHVSDCDGLSIMVEVLSPDEVRAIFDARERSNAQGLDLLSWSDGVRHRPAPVPQ